MKQKNLLSVILLFMLLSAGSVHAFDLDSSWVVACSQDALPTEKKAAAEIVRYIEAVSGLKLETVQNAPAKTKAIIVKSGNFAHEEWSVNGSPAGITVSGGLPNGVLYGAYTFIEKGLGCRFLTLDYEYIPEKERISLPEEFDFSQKPFFAGRCIYVATPAQMNSQHIFQVRRKLNSLVLSPEYGWCDRNIAGRNGHTYHLYTASFPQDQEEYFSLKEGKRLRPINGMGPGQLCFTYPGTRDLVVKKMAAMIEADRKSCADHAKNYKIIPPSYVIDVSANDNSDKCECAGCLALQKKYGGNYSGVLLDFTNDIAGRIEKLHPGTVVQTFAYQYSEDPPTGIKARQNIQIQLAMLGGEFPKPGVFRRDSLHSLTHPNNMPALERLQGWANSGASLKIWDYWIIYSQRTLFPYTYVQAIAPNLKTYAANRVSRIFTENEYVSDQGMVCGNFTELAVWLGAQLMVDPEQSPEPLIAEFMKLYYGPAEKPMTGMLNCLMTAMQNEPGDIGLQGVTSKYLSKEFFEQINSLLDDAEKAAGNDPKVLPRISQERISCDYGMLYFKDRFKLNFDRQKVIARLYRNEEAAMMRFNPETQHEAIRKTMKGKYEMMVKELPIPKQFEGKNVWDFPSFKFSKTWTTEWVSDPEAADGRAMKFTGIFETQKVVSDGYHARELSFGLYDRVGENHLIMKNVPRAQMATDEKYHWYHVGRSSLKMKSMIWLHWSWQVYLFCSDDLYDPLSPDTEYDLWLSIKLEGPSYSHDSKKQDAILLDRVIFAR